MRQKVDFRESAALVLVAVLFALAAVDATLVFQSLGWSAGSTAIANDPGKFVFHALLLPAAFGVLIRRLPKNLLSVASRTARSVLALLALGLTCFFAWYALDDGIAGFCKRIPVPADVSSSDAKKGLLATRLAFDKDLIEVREERIAPATLAASAPKRIAASRALVHRAEAPGECLYDELRSVRQRWSVLLTFVGLLFVELLVLLVAAHVVTKTTISQDEMETFVVVVTMALLWFPLRIYSEWYINFAREEAFWFEHFTSAAAVAACIGLFTFSLWVSRRVATTVFLAIAGLIPTTLGVLQKYDPAVVQSLAMELGSARPPVAIAVYACVFVAIVGAAHYLWAPSQ